MGLGAETGVGTGVESGRISSTKLMGMRPLSPLNSAFHQPLESFFVMVRISPGEKESSPGEEAG